MAPIPPSRRCGFQFRAEELDDLMDLVESFLSKEEVVEVDDSDETVAASGGGGRRKGGFEESLRRTARPTAPTGRMGAVTMK